MIEQDKILIEVFRRNTANRWELYPFRQGDTVEFASLEFQSKIAGFYEDVFS